MLVRLLAPVLAVVLAACVPAAPAAPVAAPPTAPAASASPVAAFPAVVTDFQGKAITVAARPARIVSIGASNTEFLFALGVGDRVVGVDDFSDLPVEAKAKEKVGGVKPNVEKIVSLRPDLVVSVKISDGSLERIAAQSITVIVLDPRGLADTVRTAELLGTATGADGKALARRMQEGLDAVRAKAASVKKKRVFHEVDASDPTKLFTAGPGSFIHEMLELAGGINIAAGTGSPFPQLSAEEVIRQDPEVIVLGDADYGMTAEQVQARPGWSAITAVRSKRIVGIDASLMHRPGPRLAEAAEAYFRIIRDTP